MAKTTKTRRKVARVSSTHEQKIRAAMGKAIREVRRNADINKIKLAVADKKIVVCPQIVPNSSDLLVSGSHTLTCRLAHR